MQFFALTKKGMDHEENEDSFLIDTEKNLFAVADGVSIPKGGGEAAKLACKFLSENFHGDLKQAFYKANTKIFKERIKGKCGFTTLTALHIGKNNKAQLCWVGDSPAFLVREGKIELLTGFEDSYGNVLLQAIGEESINVHERVFEARENDFMILCTDGISSVLSLKRILFIVLTEKTPEKICKALVKEAEKKESVYRDDKTAVVVKIT